MQAQRLFDTILQKRAILQLVKRDFALFRTCAEEIQITQHDALD